MSRYIRNYVPGRTFFFTLVAYRRRRFLTTELARQHLRQAIEEIRQKLPFTIDAWVLLPDHLHAIWTLPPGDSDYSLRWKQIKEEFTSTYLEAGGEEAPVSVSRKLRGERGIWQRRFWEHTIEDEDDLIQHFDYLHYNPVKHGLVKCVCDYPWSTFHRHVKEDIYPIAWGEAELTFAIEVPEP